jgi:hypothetical protein
VAMVEDLLSRKAIDRRLLRDVRARTQGRKLVGVEYDDSSRTWYAVLKTGPLPVRVGFVAKTSTRSSPKMKAKLNAGVRHRKK